MAYDLGLGDDSRVEPDGSLLQGEGESKRAC